MKHSRIILALFLVCFITVGFAFPQTDSKEQYEQKPVRVIANLMVLDAEGKFANDVKREDIKIFEDNEEQEISYFAAKENALNIGFVMDNSGSMRYRLGQTVAIGRTIVSNLRPQDEAFVLRFVSQYKITKEQDWTSNVNELKKTFDNMYVEGGQSALLDGIFLGAKEIIEREKSASSERYALILISDGEDRDSYYRDTQLFDLIKDSEMQVFPIIVFTDSPQKVKERIRNFANKLALETGGTAFFLDKKQKDKEIINALKALVAELRSQYIIGYTSTNQNRDGLSRTLRVEIADGKNGEKRTGIIRENFIVPENQKSK